MHIPLSHSAALTLTLNSQLDYAQLEPGLVAYRLRMAPAQSEDLGQFSAAVKEVCHEGFCAPAALQQFKAGESSAIARLPVELTLVKPGFREALQTLGFYGAMEAQEAAKQPWSSNTPYTDLVEGDAHLDDLVHIEVASHMVFDRKGVVLPVAYHLDYMDAGLHNCNYDLQKAASLLKNDPRVTFLDGRGRPLGDKSPSPIRDIPGYNRNEGRTQYLELRYAPTADDAARLWAQQNTYGSKYPSSTRFRAMLDLDILNLASGGARYAEPLVFNEDEPADD